MLDGQEAPVVRLDDLVKEALEKSPEILAAKGMWEMAKAKAPQAKALPDPTLQFELQNIGLTGLTVGEMDMSMAGISLSQTIPYPGKRGLRREAAEKEAEGAGAMADAARLSVVSRLKVAYYDLAFTHQSLDVVERTRRVLQDFEKTAQARYSVGEGIQQDVLKVQVELSMLTQRTATLEQMREGTGAMINSLLDRPPDAPLGRPEDLSPARPVPPLAELNRLALENNPELKARQRAIEASQTQVALMKKEYKPDFTVSGGWRSRGGLEDMYQVMVEVELPWQRERRKYGVQEALASTEAAQKNRRAMEEMVLAKVRDLSTMAGRAEQLARLYQTAIIPQATFSLESATSAYRVGKVDLLMVLDNVRALLDNELMVQEQLTDYHKAIARLEEVVGAAVVQ
jgi:outer membrane protein TolC